ncbi:hypothetical protein LTR85_005865 [Meristemomyces frigidus]|nr:hypothetical protein LTR85_005865 [Meristemomyces frigidus]
MLLRRRSVKQTSNASQTQYAKKNILVKDLGAGDNGETYCAISKYDADRVVATHSAYNNLTPACFDELRAKLTVVKFYKPSNIEGDLSNEINFLTKAITTKHPRITSWIDSHMRGGSQSLTLPLCSGGNLESFTEEHGATFSPSSSGMQDMTPAPGHPSVFHGDLRSGNTVLRPWEDSDCSFGNYPNMVVADFGRAQKLHEDAPCGERAHHLRSQWRDVGQIGCTMSYLRSMMRYLIAKQDCAVHCGATERCSAGLTAMHAKSSSLTDSTLGLWIEQFSTIASDGSKPITDCLPFLTRFLATAKRQRALCYEPLSAEAIAYMSGKKVSNEELTMAWVQRMASSGCSGRKKPARRRRR